MRRLANQKKVLQRSVLCFHRWTCCAVVFHSGWTFHVKGNAARLLFCNPFTMRTRLENALGIQFFWWHSVSILLLLLEDTSNPFCLYSRLWFSLLVETSVRLCSDTSAVVWYYTPLSQFTQGIAVGLGCCLSALSGQCEDKQQSKGGGWMHRQFLSP